MSKDSAGNYLVAANVTESGEQRVAVARFDPDGALDVAYGGGDGVTTLNLSGLNEEAHAIATNADDTSLVLVTEDPAGTQLARVVKLSALGVVDGTFGTAGFQTVGAGYGVRHAMYRESTGKFVAAWNDGGGDGSGRISRWSAAGVLEFEQQFSNAVIGTSQIADDLYAVATRNINDATDANITIGLVDFSGPSASGFSGPTITDFNPSTVDSFGYGLVGLAGSGGKYLVAGTNNAGDQPTVARVTAGFALDATFGGTGVVAVNGGWLNGYFESVKVLAGGDILASGWVYDGTDTLWATVRLDTTGALVPSYGVAGIKTQAVGTGGYAKIYDSRIDAPNAVHTGTVFEGGFYYIALGRTLLTDGSLDTTFGNP